MLRNSVIAVSLAALCISAGTHRAAAARAPEDSPAPHKSSPRPMPTYRAGTNTFAAAAAAPRMRGVLYRAPADSVPVGRLASGWRTSGYGRNHLYPTSSAVLQCVPFARANSGIEIVGNAATWWNAAAGVYQRGNRPEPGAVLNFRANGSMRLGHVAVVRQVINGREIEIDHANWSYAERGNIARNVSVIDVSERNDWTAVRVELGRSGEYGSVYPTYGFIYDRPAHGTVMATSRETQGEATFEEVAEAPDHAAR